MNLGEMTDCGARYWEWGIDGGSVVVVLVDHPSIKLQFIALFHMLSDSVDSRSYIQLSRYGR